MDGRTSGYENISTSELRLKLTDVARRVERQKVRVIIRRRFDAVGMMVPLEDFEGVKDRPPTEVIRSIRDARGGIAGVIDRLADGTNSFLLEHRGVRVAALLPMQALASLHPTGGENELGAASGRVPAYSMSTVPVGTDGVQGSTEVVLAADLVDQQGETCIADGMITLRTDRQQKYVWGIFRPSRDVSKLMIEIGNVLIREFRPVANRPEYFEFGDVEVDRAATPDDVRLLRLA